MSAYHTPVLLEETLSRLLTDTSPEALYMDLTLGGANHAQALLERTRSRLIGIDRDEDALAEAKIRLAPYSDRVRLLHGNHDDLESLMAAAGVPPGTVTGILMDLGVSSHQFDEAARGFSYHEEAPLDMRMDRTQGPTCADFINGAPPEEIARVLRDYGEEPFAGRIARAIADRRPIETTTQLAEIVKNAIPAARRRTGPHPARRSFQALRIHTNAELVRLGDTLETALSWLRPGGRLCVITFHSLEDRIVKTTFARMVNPCTCPPRIPVCICGKKSQAVAVTRKPISPSAEEIEENPRSRSAHLRVVERTLEENSK